MEQYQPQTNCNKDLLQRTLWNEQKIKMKSIALHNVEPSKQKVG